MCGARSGFFEKEENNRNGCNVQQEIRVEVEKRVERLVRTFHREVLRTVEKGTEHEWNRTPGPVAEQFLEHVLDKSERAKGTS